VQAVIASVANGQAQAAEQLSARVHAMGDLRQRCAYREMGTALPGLVACPWPTTPRNALTGADTNTMILGHDRISVIFSSYSNS
jgi:hypothetical protein